MKIRKIAVTVVALGVLAVGLIFNGASPEAAVNPTATMRCTAIRTDNTWMVKVTGPGTVHRITAQHRTTTLPSPVKLARNQTLDLDWSGMYAPNPGKCVAS